MALGVAVRLSTLIKYYTKIEVYVIINNSFVVALALLTSGQPSFCASYFVRRFNMLIQTLQQKKKKPSILSKLLNVAQFHLIPAFYLPLVPRFQKTFGKTVPVYWILNIKYWIHRVIENCSAENKKINI